GYNNDLAKEGVLLKETDSLEVAIKKAAEYVSANATKGGRAEILAYNQKPAKKQVLSLDKPKKKELKEEKKDEPIPDYKARPVIDVEPYNPRTRKSRRTASSGPSGQPETRSSGRGQRWSSSFFSG